MKFIVLHIVPLISDTEKKDSLIYYTNKKLNEVHVKQNSTQQQEINTIWNNDSS